MPERTAVIFNRHSHKPLDVRGGSTAPGTKVQQFLHHGGANQRWTVRDSGPGGPQGFTLSSLGQALTIDPRDVNKKNVSIEPPAANTAFADGIGQLWALEELPRPSALDTRRYRIRNTKEGTVLGLSSDNTNDGTEVVVGPDQNKESQRWELLYQLNLLPPNPPGQLYYTPNNRDIMVIFNQNSGKCLDVPGLTPNNADLQQFTYNAGRNQFWSLGNPFHSFAVASGIVLRPLLPMHTGGGTFLDLKDPFAVDPSLPVAARMQVVQRQVSGATERQGWGIWPHGGGDFLITNGVRAFSPFPPNQGGFVLDVVNGDRNDRALIQIHAVHQGPNQIWAIWVSEPFA